MRYLVNQALCIEIYHTMIGGFIIDELCHIISCMITIMTPIYKTNSFCFTEVLLQAFQDLHDEVFYAPVVDPLLDGLDAQPDDHDEHYNIITNITKTMTILYP